MQSSDPLNTLAYALNAALLTDLPAISYTMRDEQRTRRPRREEVDIHLFNQQWSSTALGFSGSAAGQVFTSAYTAVVSYDRTACVYFAERLAYIVDARDRNFREDLMQHHLEAQDEARKRYGATISHPTAR
jgi:hypothetical protein